MEAEPTNREPQPMGLRSPESINPTTPNWWWRLPDDPRELDGRDLRYQLTQILTERGPSTVAELGATLRLLGFRLTGRPSKTISDALRWEMARGRVVRTGRGSYRLGVVPRSTAYRIARRSRDRRAAVTPDRSGRRHNREVVAES